MANTKVTSRVIADNAVGITQLNVSDGSDGQALTTNGSGTLSFATISAGVAGISTSANATAITIDSSENVTFSQKVGIVVTPTADLTLASRAYNDSGAGNASGIRFTDGGDGTADAILQSIRVGNDGAHMFMGANCYVSTSGGAVQFDSTENSNYVDCNAYAGAVVVGTSAAGSNPSERMRINSDGVVLINRTSPAWSSSKLEVDSNARIGNIYLQGDSSNSTIFAGNGNFKVSSLEFNGGGSGLDFDVNIVVTGVGITNRFKVDSPSGDTFTNDGTISSLSDERIKTDINDLTDGLDIVKQLRPVTFKYNDTTEDEEGKKELGTADDTVRYGFIAQEVEEVAPHYVETSTRKINNEEVDDFKSMSTTRMIPMLFKAIQEQQTIIDDLKTRIETLQSN